MLARAVCAGLAAQFFCELWSDLVSGVIGAVAFVLFLAWVYRAAARLSARQPTALHCTPAFCVIGIVTPLVNLSEARMVIDDLWRAGETRSVRIVTFWWLAFLLSTIVDFVASESLSRAWVVAGFVGDAVSSALLIYIVWRADQHIASPAIVAFQR